jgi:hypothetical protein
MFTEKVSAFWRWLDSRLDEIAVDLPEHEKRANSPGAFPRLDPEWRNAGSLKNVFSRERRLRI